jgi:hypothetical protein
VSVSVMFVIGRLKTDISKKQKVGSDLHFEVHIVEVLVDGVFCRVVLDKKLAVFVDFKRFLKIWFGSILRKPVSRM